MLDLLLSEEAWGRWGIARGAGGPCRPAQGGGPSQRPVRPRGASLEVRVIVQLLPNHSRGRRVQVPQDLYDGLQLAGDVVLQQAGGHDRHTRAGVPVEQSPVVKNEAFTVLQKSRKSYLFYLQESTFLVSY